MRLRNLVLGVTLGVCAAVWARPGQNQTLRHEAWVGADCGEVPNSLLDPAPRLWGYPDCSNREDVRECAPGSVGYFYRLGHPNPELRSTCCTPPFIGVANAVYTKQGVLIEWEMGCWRPE